MAGNFIVVRAFTYVAGAIIDPDENNPNENTIYNAHNAAFNAVTGHQHTGAVGDAPKILPSGIDLTTLVASLTELPPIGTILPHYDYGQTLTFDNTKWAYCDGTNKVFAGIGNQATPDLSGRYLVGFGTDGTGNISNFVTAPWDVAAVGNVGSVINFAHDHAALALSINNHTHTVDPHTHSLSNHTHDTGNMQFGIGTIAYDTGADTLDVRLYNSGVLTQAFNAGRVDDTTHTDSGTIVMWQPSIAGVGGMSLTTGVGGVGASGVPSSADTGNASSSSMNNVALVTNALDPGTDSALSAAQDIRPRSIRVRYIIRYT